MKASGVPVFSKYGAKSYNKQFIFVSLEECEYVSSGLLSSPAPNVSEKGSGESEHVTGTGGLDLGKSGKPLITTRGLYTYVTSEHLPSTGGPQQIQPGNRVWFG